MGGLFTGDSERQLKEGSGNIASLSMEALLGEPGGGAHLVGTLKDMKKALEMGNSLHRGPV